MRFPEREQNGEKISVLMSTFCEPEDWIRAAVESVLRQSYSNFEFVILADKPDDPVRIDMLRGYEAADRRIRLVVNEENLGLVKSLNKGLRFCTGDYIARMDADDISLPGRFERQIEYIEGTHSDLVGCHFEVFSEERTVRVGRPAVGHEACSAVLRYENSIMHPSWMVRKEVYDTLGGYQDMDACEDFDFLIRAVLRGYRIGNVPEVLVRYRDNPRSISHEKAGRQYAIAQLLAETYRRGESVETEKYKAYLSSPRYFRLCRIRERIQKLDSERKNPGISATKRALLLFQLLRIREFREMKYIRLRVRWLKKHDIGKEPMYRRTARDE